VARAAAAFDVPGDTGHVEWTFGLHEFRSGAIDRLGEAVEQLVVILSPTQASVNEIVDVGGQVRE
jgi:hypothetical protein